MVFDRVKDKKKKTIKERKCPHLTIIRGGGGINSDDFTNHDGHLIISKLLGRKVLYLTNHRDQI